MTVNVRPLRKRAFKCNSCEFEKEISYEKGIDTSLTTDLLWHGFQKSYDTALIQLFVAKQINYLTNSYHRTVRISETIMKCLSEITMISLAEKFTKLGNKYITNKGHIIPL